MKGEGGDVVLSMIINLADEQLTPEMEVLDRAGTGRVLYATEGCAGQLALGKIAPYSFIARLEECNE
jgi:hypothetical protein